MIIKGNSLIMTRGDTEPLTVSCPSKPFVDGDIVELTVRKAAGFGPALIRKKVTQFTEEGKAQFEFEPADTGKLDFGTYSYDVQVTYADIGVKTIIKPSDFVLDKENTYEDEV